MTKFRHLPPVGRLIIITVAAGVLAIAGVACATSFNAVLRLVGMLGLYSGGITMVYPMLLDTAFIVAELAAILGGIMRAVTRSDEVTKGWPTTTMLLCGVCTIAFNVFHAILIGGLDDPLTPWRCIVASLPPVLMIVSFQVLIAMVKWVMLHLGRPLNSAQAMAPMGGYAPPPGVGPAMYGQPAPWGAFPSATTPGNGHYGHELNGTGDPSATKRSMAEMYLSGCGERLGAVTGSEIVHALAQQGVAIDERDARRVLEEYKAAHMPAPKRRR